MANPNPSPGTRFKDGCPPGPGRPRTKPLTDRIRARLEEPGADGRALADELVDCWADAIRAGDTAALRTLLERIEGKVADQVEHAGSVTIRVEYDDGPHPDDPAPEAAPETG